MRQQSSPQSTNITATVLLTLNRIFHRFRSTFNPSRAHSGGGASPLQLDSPLGPLRDKRIVTGGILQVRCGHGESHRLVYGDVFRSRSVYLLSDLSIFRLFATDGGSQPRRIAAICTQSGMELSSIYTRENRTRFLIAAAILIVLIATIDWLTKPYISIGFLYLFPIMLIAGFLPRWQIVLVALVCAVLQELFSELPSSEAITRLLMASAGFVGTGLFVSEIIRSRQVALEHLEEVETHSEVATRTRRNNFESWWTAVRRRS